MYDEFATNWIVREWVPQGTFLGDPQDIHADLIEFALSCPPFTKIDVSSWSSTYQEYANHNNYHSFDLSHTPPVDLSSPSALHAGWLGLRKHQPVAVLTELHATPLMLAIGLATKRLILFWGPDSTVLLHYALALLSLGATCLVILRDEGSRLLAFVTLSLSFPFLLILDRGNQGALITGISLIFFVYLACTSERYILAALLLALACNIRPNALLLAPLLFCFGPRRFTGSFVVLTGAGGACLLLAYKFDQFLYPGYHWAVFTQALHTYFRVYVLGAAGNADNNSAFGAFKAIYLFPDETNDPLHYHLFDLVSKAFGGIFLLLTVWAWILFACKKLSRFEFAYISLAAYVLDSAVFATYHLFVFAIFPLLLCRDRDTRNFGPADQLILFSSVFILIPKNYLLIRSISADVVLNPLALLAGALLVLLWQSGLDFSVTRKRQSEKVKAQLAV
jgi:hypothetical protein